MKDAADLKAKAKSRRRDRRNHDKERKEYSKPTVKTPYDRNAFKKGIEDR